MQFGDKVEVLNGKYAGAHGHVYFVYPDPRYIRVRLIGGKFIERVIDSVRLIEAQDGTAQ